MTMDERSVLDTVQRWRRTKYSARPFALTILAISLMTLLAWAKQQRSGAPDHELLRKRDVTILDEEVQRPATIPSPPCHNPFTLHTLLHPFCPHSPSLPSTHNTPF